MIWSLLSSLIFHILTHIRLFLFLRKHEARSYSEFSALVLLVYKALPQFRHGGGFLTLQISPWMSPQRSFPALVRPIITPCSDAVAELFSCYLTFPDYFSHLPMSTEPPQSWHDAWHIVVHQTLMNGRSLHKDSCISFYRREIKSQESRHGFPNVTKSGNAKMVSIPRSYIGPTGICQGKPPKSSQKGS